MMTKNDFIEKLTNTDLFSINEATIAADSTEDYEDLCRDMYFAAEDLESFNALIGDKINRNFTMEQLNSLNDIMDVEW